MRNADSWNINISLYEMLSMELVSDPKEKLKYPKCVWFIIFTKLCERFTFYGLRTVLVLYLTTVLKFNGDEATITYHSFECLTSFTTLPGAIMADSYWGKFDTIVRLSLLYALGNTILVGASMADVFSLDVQKTITLIGLFLISTGSGGIQPCIFTLGGEQFKLPQQESQLRRYTTKFMTALYLGPLVSIFLTPELRQNVQCFGKDTCYPLAFGVPAVFMIIAIVIFVSGKNMYFRKKPEQSVISRSLGCIYFALRTKMTKLKTDNTYWLNNAKGAYTDTEVSETRATLNAIAMFSAFPVYCALYELLGSRWTLQAMLMNGRVEFLNWTIKPDQMLTLEPFLAVTFIILFDVLFYPILAKVGIRKPLQKLTFSGILAVLAFVFAAVLQFKIFGNTTAIPNGEGHLNIYNGLDCNVIVHSPATNKTVDRIDPLDMMTLNEIPVYKKAIVPIRLKFDQDCFNTIDNIILDTTVTFNEGEMVSYYLTRSNSNTTSFNRVGNTDNLIKEKHGNPKLRLLIDETFDFYDNITLTSADKESFNSYSISAFRGSDFNVVRKGKYNLIYNGQIIPTTVNLIPATFYTLTLQHNGEKMDVKLFTMDEGNYLHIVWQLPQYICMILSDAIFVVISTEIAFTEAPASMKSFVSAASLMTTALGNVLVVVISAMSIKSQAYEYLLYSGLMFANTLLYVYFSIFYKSLNDEVYYNSSLKEDKNDEIPVI